MNKKFNITGPNNEELNVQVIGFFRIPDIEKEYIMYSIISDQNNDEGVVLLGEVIRNNENIQILGIKEEEIDIVTAIDYFIPDPCFGLDEAVFTGVTTLLGISSSIVNNKIKDLANTGNTDLQMSEINNLAQGLGNIASTVQQNRTNNMTK